MHKYERGSDFVRDRHEWTILLGGDEDEPWIIDPVQQEFG